MCQSDRDTAAVTVSSDIKLARQTCKPLISALLSSLKLSPTNLYMQTADNIQTQMKEHL